MAPSHYLPYVRRTVPAFNGSWRAEASSAAVTLEAWGQGFMVGALIIMVCGTVANMRKGVLLHKLILVEVSRCTKAEALALTYLSLCVAVARDPPWNLLLHDLRRLRMVPLRNGNVTLHIMLCTQHCGMAENQALRLRQQISLRRKAREDSPVDLLGDTWVVNCPDRDADCLQFPLLQRYQQNLHQDPAYRISLQVRRYVGE